MPISTAPLKRWLGTHTHRVNLKQANWAINMIHNLRMLGLAHYVLLVDEAATCEAIKAVDPTVDGCVYSTYMQMLASHMDPARKVGAALSRSSRGHASCHHFCRCAAN